MKRKRKPKSLPKEGLARLPEVLEAMGIGKTTWYQGIKSGKYPKQVRPSKGTVAWRVEEIRALVANLEVKEDGI